MSVEIQLGQLRLVSDRTHGCYSVEVLGSRGPDANEPGAEYVKRRYSGLSLEASLAKLIELWPQRSGVQVTNLARLSAELREIRELIRNGLGLALPPGRCEGCGRFRRAWLLTEGLCQDCRN